MKKLIIILIFSLNLFSYSLIDYYRAKGNFNLSKKAETLLQSHDFWLKRLKTYDTDFGYYENLKNLIIVNKSFQSLDLYQLEDEQFELIQTADILVGKNRGHKVIEGDRKTPTGVYNLTKRLYRLNQFYGPLAIVLSYPNIFDKLKGRTGSGIWIHGKPLNGAKRDSYTKGCVALDNNRLKIFNNKIKDVDRSLIILEDGRLKKVSKKDLATVLSSLYKWLASWRDNRYSKYIEFYSKEFKRYDGHGLKWFKDYKKSIFRKKERKKIFVTKVNITPYPNSYGRNIFVITFQEEYKTNTFHWEGKKQLFVEVINRDMKIVIER